MSAESAEVVRYLVDTKIGWFTVKAFATGLLWAIGHNPTIAIRDYSGEAGFVPTTLDQAFFRMAVRPDSFEVAGDASQKDKLEIETKMKQEVLETARYPQISFESSQITVSQIGETSYTAHMSGHLTLHGVTRRETMTFDDQGAENSSGGYHMCLAIPGKIIQISSENENSALVEVVGVRRHIDLGLLEDDRPNPGDWVLIHVGYAMSKISEQDAAEQMRSLEMLGESDAAMQEIRGYGIEGTEQKRARDERRA